MRIIPVLDLMNGHVVRGIAGRRETYAPVQSQLVNSSAPLDVARAFRGQLGLNDLYVADLDAIMRDVPHWDVLRDLAAEGFELLVDAGVRDAERAERLLAHGARQVIVALETLHQPQSLNDILASIGPERAVFSLDLMDGQPMGDLQGWKTVDPLVIARRAIAQGVSSLIVLDLSAVGLDGGVPTLDLCRQLRSEFPDLTLISGGGVRNRSDLITLRQAGLNGALVASALHNGQIDSGEIQSLSQPHAHSDLTS